MFRLQGHVSSSRLGACQNPYHPTPLNVFHHLRCIFFRGAAIKASKEMYERGPPATMSLS